MSDETPASKAAARQAKLLAKSQERLAKITGAAKGEGRIASDSKCLLIIHKCLVEVSGELITCYFSCGRYL